jgi:hypothetical protein
MTYKAIGLQPIHVLPSPGMSALAIYKAHNTTIHAETQDTKARGRHSTKRVMMILEHLAAHAQRDLMSLARELRQLRQIPTDMVLPGVERSVLPRYSILP